MPRTEILDGFQMAIEKAQTVEAHEAENGEPVVVPLWTLILTDRRSGDQIRISFKEDTRDVMVRQLTGVVMPGGFPSV
jgi:hypothetical protein